MDFSEALKHVKSGKQIHRTGWHGVGLTLTAQFPDDHSKMNNPYIYITTSKGNVPWVPSQADLFAEDWNIVNY